MDVYSLLSIVKSYYRPDNYDLHVKLCIASKKYYEFTKDLNIDEYFVAGVISQNQSQHIAYIVCGVIHRLYKPAVIEYYNSYSVKSKRYYTNNELHRDNGPAYIEYYESGSVKCERYYNNGKLHRTDGPARISYYENGSVSSKLRFIDGVLCDISEFINMSYSTEC